MDRPGAKPKPPKEDGCCLSCKYAKQRFKESCYCVKYGITIGYSKDSCRGWVREI
jgi:hypothetical protein